MSSYYLTTPIYYANDLPHIGHAYTTVVADAIARYQRSRGHDVFLLTGTDEHGVNIERIAAANGGSATEHVDHVARVFGELWRQLDVSYDRFIRTTEAAHQRAVLALWQRLQSSGDLYRGTYSGAYCSKCEAYYQPDELVGDACRVHGVVCDVLSEENWFFRLSRYRHRLRDLYKGGEIEIVPQSRRNEVLAWIDQLEDFSISRSARRARGWGIAVPGDPDQVIYVWFDALGNYITGLGYGTDAALLARFWAGATSREHVIGKGITRFHAVYWPAMLLSAGLPVPTRILVHGYVTVEGRKIGKSAGNAIDPTALAEEFGTDALRYYLLRHIRSTGDGDFLRERLRQAYESELAGQFGNLAHRVLSMIERYCDGVVPAPPEGFCEDNLLRTAAGLAETVAEHLRSFAFDRALDAIWAFIAQANRYVSEEEPWALAKRAAASPGRQAGGAFTARLHGCLFSLAVALDTIGRAIAPLLPGASLRLARKLGRSGGYDWPEPASALIGSTVGAGVPLFPTAAGTIPPFTSPGHRRHAVRLH